MDISANYDIRRGRRAVIALLALSIICAAGFAGVYVLRRAYPLRYVGLIRYHAAENELDPVLVAALIHAESRFNPAAVSSAGARGLMQLMEPTAVWAAHEIGLEDFRFEQAFDPTINIKIGTWYLSRLINQFDGVQNTALAAYNAGSGNVSRWLDNAEFSADGRHLDEIPFGETRHYLVRIEGNLRVYRVLFWLYDFMR